MPLPPLPRRVVEQRPKDEPHDKRSDLEQFARGTGQRPERQVLEEIVCSVGKVLRESACSTDDVFGNVGEKFEDTTGDRDDKEDLCVLLAFEYHR